MHNVFHLSQLCLLLDNMPPNSVECHVIFNQKTTYMKITCIYIHALGFHNRKWYHVWCKNCLVVFNIDMMKINSPCRCGVPMTKKLLNLWVLQNVTWLCGQTRHYPNPHNQHVSPMNNFIMQNTSCVTKVFAGFIIFFIHDVQL